MSRAVKSLKIVATLYFLGSLATTAAELPLTKLSPITAPAPIWTGFYAGLNAGSSWATNNNIHVNEASTWLNPNIINSYANTTNAAVTDTGSSITIPMQISPNFMGGFQAGYNEKILGSAVAGIETDFQGLVVTGSLASTIAQSFGFYYSDHILNRLHFNEIYNLFSVSKNLSYIGTTRGRVGYLAFPDLLVYLTGGLAYGGVSLNSYTQQQNSNGVSQVGFIGSSQYSNTKLGWAAGSGLEWFFSANWSLKAEYLYYSLGSVNMAMGQAISSRLMAGNGLSVGDVSRISALTARTNFSGNIVHAGVNYHFNFTSSPVVTKY